MSLDPDAGRSASVAGPHWAAEDGSRIVGTMFSRTDAPRADYRLLFPD